MDFVPNKAAGYFAPMAGYPNSGRWMHVIPININVMITPPLPLAGNPYSTWVWCWRAIINWLNRSLMDHETTTYYTGTQ